MSPWDCAALVPVVNEAGGCCFDLNGRATIYGDGMVSANRILGMELVKSIEKQRLGS